MRTYEVVRKRLNRLDRNVETVVEDIAADSANIETDGGLCLAKLATPENEYSSSYVVACFAAGTWMECTLKENN